MFRLKANKTSLYKLVGEFEDLPPMRRVTITKAYRTPDWWLKWTDADGLLCVAFFSTCMGKALLSIDKKEFCGPQVSRVVHDLDTKDLLERGMVEEFTTAAENLRAFFYSMELALAVHLARIFKPELVRRYQHTKKKRTRKKYEKRILAWFGEVWGKCSD